MQNIRVAAGNQTQVLTFHGRALTHISLFTSSLADSANNNNNNNRGDKKWVGTMFAYKRTFVQFPILELVIGFSTWLKVALIGKVRTGSLLNPWN